MSETHVAIKGKRTKRQKSNGEESCPVTTVEDEHMARCLILLSQFRTPKSEPRDVYTCSTCGRIFQSFQALGGHRASHKKIKSETAERKRTYFNSSVSLQIQAHECGVCGAQFVSGQALGGHMRRHRTIVTDPTVEKSRKVVLLDLNYPPVPEGHAESKFSFRLDEGSIFAASSLVDCHY